MNRTMAETHDAWVGHLINLREEYQPVSLKTILEVGMMVDMNARMSRGDGFFVIQFSDNSSIVYDDDEVE